MFFKTTDPQKSRHALELSKKKLRIALKVSKKLVIRRALAKKQSFIAPAQIKV